MFQIPDLYNAVFGFTPGVSVPKPPSPAEVQRMVGLGGFTIPEQNSNNSEAIYRETIGASTIKSSLGNDGFYPIWLGGEQLKYFDKNGELKLKQFDKLQLPLSILVDQDTSQVRVDTAISGGFGTVKELFAMADWQFRIRGLLIDEGTPGRSALELKQQLIAMRQFADSIPVEGFLFAELGVDRVCINNIGFRQLEGQPWVIGFDMQLESDFSLEIEIQSGQQLRRV